MLKQMRDLIETGMAKDLRSYFTTNENQSITGQLSLVSEELKTAHQP